MGVVTRKARYECGDVARGAEEENAEKSSHERAGERRKDGLEACTAFYSWRLLVLLRGEGADCLLHSRLPHHFLVAVRSLSGWLDVL